MFLFSVSSVFFYCGKADAQSVGGTTSGGNIYCASANSGFINLDAGTYHGTTITWQKSIDGGLTWQPTGTTVITQQSYNNLLVSTCYRALVKDGTFPDSASTVSCINIYPSSVGGTISGGGTFCRIPGSGAGQLHLTGNTSDTIYWQYSINGGTSWNSISSSDTTLLNHPNIAVPTLYWAIVRNGPFQCRTDTSVKASFTFDSVSVAGTITSSDTVCVGINSGTLHLTGNNGHILNWMSSINNGGTWSSIPDTTASDTYTNLLQSTRYTAVVKNGACPSDTAAFASITVVPPSPVNAGVDTTLFAGQAIKLHGTGSGTPLWSPPLGLDSFAIFRPTASPAVTTVYTLTVVDRHSCIASDSVKITIKLREFKGIVANLLTPNGDGVNDSWYIQDILNYPANEVFIYNIYGSLVYTKKGYTNDWQGTYNGSPLPDGTYYYVLKFDDTDYLNKGSLDILRNK